MTHEERILLECDIEEADTRIDELMNELARRHCDCSSIVSQIESLRQAQRDHNRELQMESTLDSFDDFEDEAMSQPCVFSPSMA